MRMKVRSACYFDGCATGPALYRERFVSDKFVLIREIPLSNDVINGCPNNCTNLLRICRTPGCQSWAHPWSDTSPRPRQIFGF